MPVCLISPCMPARSSSSSANPSNRTRTRAAEIHARAARACAWPFASMKELPHELPPLVAAGAALLVAGRARVRRAGDLRAPQRTRLVRAAGEAQRRTRLARYGVGTLAARTKLLVIECFR